MSVTPPPLPLPVLISHEEQDAAEPWVIGQPIILGRMFPIGSAKFRCTIEDEAY